MRKKILSVLLALCMVLTLLPVAAFAAKLTDAQVADLKAKGYTDAQIEEIQKQIADYESDEIVLVFEDTVIDQAESRLVLVVGKCNVEVSAALETGIVVAPGAADAKVALKAGADVNAVVVLDKAEVVVEKDAKAANVTLAAAEAAATVEGSVDTVAVNEAAEKATVTVAEGAAVAAVEVAAPEAKADIAGTVSTVVVAETAKGAETAVASTATVSAVTVAAPEAKTDVAGTVSSVTVAETAEGAATTVSGTVDSVAVDAPNTKTDVAETGSVGSVNVGENATGTEINAADGANVGEVTDPAGNNSGNTAADPEPSASPSASPAPAPEEPDPVDPSTPGTGPSTSTASVIVIASGSSASVAGKGTVGIAIPVAEGKHYVYCVITKDGNNVTSVTLKTPSSVSKDQLAELDGYVEETNYDVLTFDLSTEEKEGTTIILKEEVAEGTTTSDVKAKFDALQAATEAKTAADAAYTQEIKDAKTEAEKTLSDNAKPIAANALKTILERDDLATLEGENLTKVLEDVGKQLTALGLTDSIPTDATGLAALGTTLEEKTEYTEEVAKYTDEVAKAVTDANAAIALDKEKSDAVTEAGTKETQAKNAFDTAYGKGTEVNVTLTYQEPDPVTPPTTTDPTTPGGSAAGGGENKGDGDKTEDTGDKDQAKDPAPAANNGLE